MNFRQEIHEARLAVAKDPDNITLRRDFLTILKRTQLFPDYAVYLERALRDNPPLLNFEESNAQRRDRENESSQGLNWAGFGDLPNGFRLEYRSGFVEHVICPAELIGYVPPMLPQAPIRHVSICKSMRTLASLPDDFTTLSSLALDMKGIDDRFITTELCKREWPNLRWLSLSYNTLSQEGVEQIAKSTRSQFPGLVYLELEGCPYNPVEHLSYDDGVIAYASVPDAAKLLEEKFGSLPWLYRTRLSDSGNQELREMNRFELAKVKN